eukprot:COSAG06_NODE_2374_length_6987_cov_3.378049_2_plen_458_part_00
MAASSSPTAEQLRPIRLAVVGDGGVGKRRLIESLLRRRPRANRLEGQYEEALMCRHAAHSCSTTTGCLCAPIARLVRPAGCSRGGGSAFPRSRSALAGGLRTEFDDFDQTAGRPGGLYDVHRLRYELVDGGCLQFECRHPPLLESVDAAILMFDVTSRVTYMRVPMHYRHLRRACPNIPIVLVATGVEATSSNGWRRKVKPKQINFHNHKKEIQAFVEVNLTSGENLDEPLRLLAQALEECGDWSEGHFVPEHAEGLYGPLDASSCPRPPWLPWQVAASRSPALRTELQAAFTSTAIEAVLKSKLAPQDLRGELGGEDSAAIRIHELPALLKRHAAEVAALLHCRRLLAFMTTLLSPTGHESASSKGRAVQGQLPQGQLPQGQLPQGQLPQGQLPQGQLPQGQFSPTEVLPIELLEMICCEAAEEGPARIEFAPPEEDAQDTTGQCYGPEDISDDDL